MKAVEYSFALKNELLVSPEGNPVVFTDADLSIVFSSTVGGAISVEM